MAVRIVRLGSPRARGEGLRIGTVRRPPRGVRKEEYGARDYYDVWLPELAADAETVSWALSEPWTPTRWRRYARTYAKQMREPVARHLIETLAGLSHQTSFSVGCYCEDPTYCHRSLLADLLRAAGADVVDENDARAKRARAVVDESDPPTKRPRSSGAAR